MIKDTEFGFSEPYVEEGRIHTLGTFNPRGDEINFDEIKIFLDKDLNLYCGKVDVKSPNARISTVQFSN